MLDPQHDVPSTSVPDVTAGARKRYSPPDLIAYGTVSELTTQIGSDDGQPQTPGGQFV